jgi:hypothetical protein
MSANVLLSIAYSRQPFTKYGGTLEVEAEGLSSRPVQPA